MLENLALYSLHHPCCMCTDLVFKLKGHWPVRGSLSRHPIHESPKRYLMCSALRACDSDGSGATLCALQRRQHLQQSLPSQHGRARPHGPFSRLTAGTNWPHDRIIPVLYTVLAAHQLPTAPHSSKSWGRGGVSCYDTTPGTACSSYLLKSRPGVYPRSIAIPGRPRMWRPYCRSERSDMSADQRLVAMAATELMTRGKSFKATLIPGKLFERVVLLMERSSCQLTIPRRPWKRPQIQTQTDVRAGQKDSQ